MRGSLDLPPISIRRSRIALVAVTAAPPLMGLLIFLLGGGLTMHDPGLLVKAPLVGTIPAVALVVVAPSVMALPLWAFFWGLHLTSYLEIGPDGLTQKVGWKSRSFPWSEVSNFRFREGQKIGQDAVVFDYQASREEMRSLVRGDFILHEGQGRLWPLWEMKAWPLVKLLNQAREKWSGSSRG